MGFLFVDGFDHWTAMPGTAGAKYDQAWDSSYLSIAAGSARYAGGAGLHYTDNLGGVFKSLGGNYSTLYFGMAHRVTANPVPRWYVLWSTMLSNTQRQICCTIAGSVMYFFRTDWQSGSSYSTAVTVQLNVWDYFEFEVITHSSAGRVIVKQNGVQIGDSGAGGINTAPAGANYATGLVLGYNATGYTDCVRDYDDLWVTDDQFHGDCKIITRFPSGVGNYTQFDPSTGANWECVNEAAPDTGDYVSTTVTDEIDSYEMQDIAPSAGTVKAVVGNYLCQKTDAGSRQLDMLTRLSNTDLLTGSPKGVPSSWGFLQFIQETKPGGGAWTVQNTKDAEMGMKLEV